MANNEDPFKEYPNVSKLAKMLGKNAMQEHPFQRMNNWYIGAPRIPTKHIIQVNIQTFKNRRR